MSEEEKAIERLRKRIKDNENYKTTQVWLTDDVVAVNTVLNLITKPQKEKTQEKESWEKYCNELNEEIIEKNNKIFDLEMQVEKLQKENKEKDKQIIALNQLIDEEM